MDMNRGPNLKVHVVRLTPGQEVRGSLEEYVSQNAPGGAFVLSCCGSITSATLRLAERDGQEKKILDLEKHHEVVSMVGSISRGGSHLHISLSNDEGKMVGGHLMGNAKVFTTMEVMMGEALDKHLDRNMDPRTGYDELVIRKRC